MSPSDNLAAQLSRLGLPVTRDSRRGCLRATLDLEPGRFELLVWHDSQDGDLLLLTPYFLRAPRESGPPGARTRLLEALLALNFELALGSFELDPADGEVRFRLSWPLGDAWPDDTALARAVAAVRHALEAAWPRCQRALYAPDEE